MFLIFLASAIVAQAATPPAARPPVGRGPLDSYISLDDYPQAVPTAAARPVSVVLTIGPDGRVQNCTVAASSGAALLDATTCRLLRSRSRFTPATNPAGVPIAGEVRGIIDWPAIRSGARRPDLSNPPLVRTTAPPPLITVPVAPPNTNRFAARPHADLSTYISSQDYPSDAMTAGEQGITAFALTIGPDGRISQCAIEQSSGSASLDSATCRIMASRARFSPALDREGKPSSDIYRSRIAWRLPARSTTIPDLFVARFTVDTDGKARDCVRLVESLGRTQEMKATDCGPQPPAQALLASLRTAGGEGELRARFEARLIRDASQPWPTLERSGLKILGYDLVRLRVAPGGRVLGCTVLDRQSGGLPPSNFCGPNMRIEGYAADSEAEMRIVAFFALESAG